MASHWSTLVRTYLAARARRRGLAASSRREYGYVLHDFADHMGHVRIDAPVEEIVAGIDDWLTAKGWSPSTCCTNLGIVRPFIDWCAVRTWMAPGITAELHNPRRPRHLPRALSPRQIGSLLAVVPDRRGRVIVLLEVQCGLRRAEVAGLRMDDVDLGEGAIRVRGKGGTERMVYPSDETLDAIHDWLVERGPARGALVSSYDHPGAHLTPTWVGALVVGWMRQAGLKHASRDGVSSHALRHTAATQLLKTPGANIKIVQEAMGHASITTTAIYLRADDPEVKAAMRRVSYGQRRLAAVVGDDE